MEILTIEEEQEHSTADDRLAKKTNTILPVEVIEEILSRLPVNSILQFRSVSKPWLSLISHPSFPKLHFTRSIATHRSALFVSVHDNSSRKQHFFSAALDGGLLTHLITLDDVYSTDVTEAQHLNGLLCFACVRRRSDYDYDYPQVFVVNPSTHHIFILPCPFQDIINDPWRKGCFLFGFDESRNEHKILILKNSFKSATLEVMVFSMSNYSWRNIHVEPQPPSINWDHFFYHYQYNHYRSICVNSVVHLVLENSYDILGFDFRTENFLIINTPQGVAPYVSDTSYFRDGECIVKDNKPFCIKINGCVGVVCHDRVLKNNEMHVWILQDYENRVWVREIVTFPECWVKLGEPFPAGSVNMDEIIFLKSKSFRNIANTVSIYNMKSRCFKDLQFTSGHQFPLSTTVWINQIGGYVESMVPL